MRWEHLFAFFRPFKINSDEKASIQSRVNPFGADMATDTKAKNGELLISVLETKAGILLTHISMMIAVTGLMLAISGETLWYEALLAGELAVYLLLALLCIRCQNHFGSKEYETVCLNGSVLNEIRPHHIYQDVVYGELLYREWLFHLIQAMLYILTFLLILTVFYGLLADEFGVLSGGKS